MTKHTTSIETPAQALERLLPLARTRFREESGKLTFETQSAIAKASSGWLAEANLEGVHIYRQQGGWAADVHFRDVPAGIAPVLGTRTLHPEQTREAAENVAVAILMMILVKGEQPKSTTAAFLYHGFVTDIPLDKIKMAKECEPPGIEAYVRQRLAECDAAIGMPVQRDLTLSESWDVMILGTMALCVGIMRWPELEPPPEPH